MLSNNTFDLLSALQNKSEAVAVYDVYIEDAEAVNDKRCADLWRTLKARDEEDVEMLRKEVERHVGEGSLQ